MVKDQASEAAALRIITLALGASMAGNGQDRVIPQTLDYESYTVLGAGVSLGAGLCMSRVYM